MLDAHGISPNTIPTNDVRAGLTVGSPEHRARMSFVVCSAMTPRAVASRTPRACSYALLGPSFVVASGEHAQ